MASPSNGSGASRIDRLAAAHRLEEIASRTTDPAKLYFIAQCALATMGYSPTTRTTR